MKLKFYDTLEQIEREITNLDAELYIFGCKGMSGGTTCRHCRALGLCNKAFELRTTINIMKRMVQSDPGYEETNNCEV